MILIGVIYTHLPSRDLPRLQIKATLDFLQSHFLIKFRYIYIFLPAEPPPDNDEDHEEAVGDNPEHGQAHQDSRLGLWVISAADLPTPVPAGPVDGIKAVLVQGGLDAGQDDSLTLRLHADSPGYDATGRDIYRGVI